MIRGLRRRHRLMWLVLFPILALLLAAALLSRPAPPLVDSLPEPRDAEAGGDRPHAVDESPAPREEQP